MSDYLDAWKLSEKDFPEKGTAQEKMAFFVRYAVLAPSAYNTQPWYFRIKDNVLSLYADRRHALALIDPDDRQLDIACAAALFNLRLAIEYFGYNETTELLPDPAEESLIARVKLGEKSDRTIDDSRKSLFGAITRRHMNLGAFNEKQVPDDILKALRAAAAEHGAWLHICPEPEKRDIVKMIIEADHMQATNKNFRRELASWVDPQRRLSGDGWPDLGMRYATTMASRRATIVRRYADEKGQPVSDEDLLQNPPLIAVLGSKSGGAVERLATGQAFMHVLLKAEAENVAVSTLNQPCEVPELRLVLHDELEHQGRAQLILRLGYGGKPGYTPRRPLAQVLEIQGRHQAASPAPAANDPGAGLFRRVRGLFSK